MFRAVCGALLALFLSSQAQAGRLFVVSKGPRAVEAYDPDTGKLEFSVKGAGDPHEVVVSNDGRFAYVGDAKGTQNTLTVIDVEKQAIAEQLKLPPFIQPHGLVLNHDNTMLYATCAPNRAVIEVQLSPLKVTRSFKFLADQVENLALTPDEKLIYASSSFDGNLAVIDLAKGELQRMIISGNGPEGLAVSPDGKELWVANRVSQTIAVIDIPTHKRVAEIQCVGNPMHVYFPPESNEVVVTCAVADRLAIFDRAKRTEITRFEVGNVPVELAFGEKGGPVFVTNSEGSDVAVVDLAARKVLRRFPVGADPEGIAYSSH
ncbi:MAG TPA: beta-propeller fold lactonase family protein [Candidatus Krumholzibacteria bacterium]|nr:beta-propeller fold lactonase family protein [Candidatus Krumholzibacteria bacterium]